LDASGASEAARVVVKYRDHENDLVTITSDEELQEAYHLADQFLNGALRLSVELGKTVPVTTAASLNVATDSLSERLEVCDFCLCQRF